MSAYVKQGSQLIRNRREALSKISLLSEQISFWNPFVTSQANSSVIHRVSDLTKADGHEVFFEARDKLYLSSIPGDRFAEGTGEIRNRYSDKIRIDEFRYTVKNGNDFDLRRIGDSLDAVESLARPQLLDNLVRQRDQLFFDVLQGVTTRNKVLEGELRYNPIQDPTNLLDWSTKTNFGLDELDDISLALMSGNFRSDIPRINAFDTRDVGEGVFQNQQTYAIIMDPFVYASLLKDERFQKYHLQAGQRGSGNPLFSGVFGTYKNLTLIQSTFFTGEYVPEYKRLAVEFAGLRLKDEEGNWTGDPKFKDNKDLTSRILIIGKDALRYAVGKTPEFDTDYRDFRKFSETCLTTWFGIKKAAYSKEASGSYNTKLQGKDLGVVAIDIKVVREKNK